MPDISLISEKVETTVTSFINANHDILARISVLKNELNGMFDEGLVLKQSTPALRESYDQFNTNLTAAIQGLESFAKQFKGIKDGLLEFDTKITEQIKSSGR
ncbi:hypothetical protein [Solwaraspora sp. WMMD792]|uniref:hypothetical protein n=1 Tax=Solwaraspora sp. WMMD792 TaxID=3016099 RepID=UPI0024160B12|nr:hypothetical protein [Solwaraspora sp. WMMD792]MDG4772846.1 hypothetical protein [Solwaraspora sp. WMMD792]